MKKLIALLLALLLLSATTALAADPIDLSTYTDAELAALQKQVAEEIRVRAMTKAKVSPVTDFRYVSNGTEIRINEYLGKSRVVHIPDEIDGVPVTQIFDHVFEEDGWTHTLTSVHLPAGLVSIGFEGFFRTSSLRQTLVMPATLEVIKNSGFFMSGVTGVVLQSDCELYAQCFAYCHNLGFCYVREGCAVDFGSLVFQESAIKTVVIPADVTSMSASVFSGCNKVTVYCPAGSYAEQYCKENFIACNTDDYEAMVAYYEALYPAE